MDLLHLVLRFNERETDEFPFSLFARNEPLFVLFSAFRRSCVDWPLSIPTPLVRISTSIYYTWSIPGTNEDTPNHRGQTSSLSSVWKTRS